MTVAAAPVQLALPITGGVDPDQRWRELPEVTRMQVLALLARLIARCVLAVQEDAGQEAGDE